MLLAAGGRVRGCGLDCMAFGETCCGVPLLPHCCCLSTTACASCKLWVAASYLPLPHLPTRKRTEGKRSGDEGGKELTDSHVHIYTHTSTYTHTGIANTHCERKTETRERKHVHKRERERESEKERERARARARWRGRDREGEKQLTKSRRRQLKISREHAGHARAPPPHLPVCVFVRVCERERA